MGRVGQAVLLWDGRVRRCCCGTGRSGGAAVGRRLLACVLSAVKVALPTPFLREARTEAGNCWVDGMPGWTPVAWRGRLGIP